MKSSRHFFWLIPIIFLLIALMIPLLPVYNINSVNVETEYEKLAEEIAEASGLKIGSNIFLTLLGKGNIFTMRFTEAEQKLRKKYIHLGDIRVRADFPSGVMIEYEQKEPAFEIKFGNINLITDINGCVLESRSGHELGYIRITGMNISGFALGCIVKGDISRFDYVSQIYKELTVFDKTELTAFREYIDWIDLSNPSGLALMYNGRILIKMDSRKDIAYQTVKMCKVLSEYIGYSEKGTLSFTSGDEPVFSPD